MTPDERMAALFDWLDAVLERLAWPADRQRAYLTDQGIAPMGDELAREFDDVRRAISAPLQESGTGEKLLAGLAAIEAKLAAMSAAEGISRWDALEADPGWDEVRILAEGARGSLRD